MKTMLIAVLLGVVLAAAWVSVHQMGCAGRSDLNCDGRVDVKDLSLFLKDYRK